MRYAVSLLAVGAILMAFGATNLRSLWLVEWFGFSFCWLGIAHVGGMHGVFRKRSDGTIPFWSKFLHLPYYGYTVFLWHVLRICCHESAFNRVTSDLTVGRRLLSKEVRDEYVNYIDLTAEFEEPRTIRQLPAYISYPILDGGAPTPASLRKVVTGLRAGNTYVHCAQGHGRTGLFALAMLLARGSVRSVDDGLKLLQSTRPGISLNAQQRRCIERFACELK